jgi:CheY-like chemotaxis protein
LDLPAKSPGLRFASAVDVSNSSVLVVDDEPLVRWSVSETLADAGYGVAQAHDEQSTLRAMSDADHSPDVVLLDVYLPDCSDLRVLASIRRMSPHTSVIMMTAHGRRLALYRQNESSASVGSQLCANSSTRSRRRWSLFFSCWHRVDDASCPLPTQWHLRTRCAFHFGMRRLHTPLLR